MPPKKKVNKTNQPQIQPPKDQPKLKQQPKQPQVKPQKPTITQVKPNNIETKPISTQNKQPIKQPPPKQPPPKQPPKITANSSSMIKLTDDSQLSQAQLLKRRQLRFNVIGTQITIQQADKIKQQRIAKFGGSTPENLMDIQKRKLKFRVAQDSNEEGSLQKRLEKFGGSTINQNDDGNTLEERKKKFGNVPTTLDDQIKNNNKRLNFNKHHHYGNPYKKFKR